MSIVALAGRAAPALLASQAIDWTNTEPLTALDRHGYNVVDSLTVVGQPTRTHSRPCALICADGETYWVKGAVQQGLVAELVAGRLAHLAGAGPQAKIIRVTPESCVGPVDLSHLFGVVVGTLDQNGMVNARDLALFLANGQFAPGAVEAASRARVVTFQTWLGVQDTQVMIDLTNGKVVSIDHGDCFASTSDPAQPSPIMVVEIPGVGADVGRDATVVLDALARIEAITDRQLIEAVARIPSGDPWRSPTARRWEIASWLAARRDSLRGVMSQWMI